MGSEVAENSCVQMSKSQCRREARLRGRLWRRLPREVVERVLSFLPVPDLCRYSTVSKRWNRLISAPGFGSLCLQNETVSKRRYIVARVVVETELDSDYLETSTVPGSLGWSILDLETKQWYTLKECDLSPGRVRTSLNLVSGFVAADGGLICEYTEDGCDQFIQVYNPLTNEYPSLLPSPPEHFAASPDDALINLVVDVGGCSFKVFFIYLGFEQLHSEGSDGSDDGDGFEDADDRVVMHIYESTTDKWRSSTNPSLPSELGVGVFGSSIMFGGLLYVMFCSYDLAQYWLYTYNIKEDVWKDTNMYFKPGSLSVSPQLIVSDDRLFLVSWMAPDVPNQSHCSCRLITEEILLGDVMALSVVFQMTGEEVKEIFQLPEMEESRRPWNRLAHGCPYIQAFGFDKSIMLMSGHTGISKVYNLDSCLWSQMPTNPMEPLPPLSQLWYGQPMNLRLPSSRW